MIRLIEHFLGNNRLVNVVSAAICLIGALILWEMKRDLHPPFEFEQIEVTASLPGASPQELETLVTYPIEESLKGLGGLKKISSTTQASSATLWVEFEPGYPKMTEAAEEIRQRISRVSHRFPRELLPIQVRQEKATEVFLAVYVFKKADLMNPEHRAALHKFQSQLEKIKGVSSVGLDMNERDVYVRFDPKRLEAHGVSMSQARGALSEHFSFLPLGRLRKDDHEWAAELKQPDLDLAQLRDLPLVANRIGRAVRLSDVATVEWGSGEHQAKWLVDGSEVAWMEIRKNPAADALALHDEVTAKVAELQASLPAPIEVKELMNGPYFIRQQLDILKSNGLQGLVLVLVLLTLFLHWRMALMAALGIPIAYLGSFIILKLCGISIDLLSLIGLIIVSGVLVDDAIIIAEMHAQNLEKGLKPKEAALEAVRSMILPVSGTIVTTVLAFSPILIIKGSLTFFLAAIPIVLAATLAFSWFESFFLLPNHLSHFVTTPPKDYAKRFFDGFRAFYARLLGWTVRLRYPVFVGVILAFVGAIWIATQKLEHYFNLSIGQEQVKVYATLKKSDSLEDTERQIQPLLKLFQGYPKEQIDYFWANVGRHWRDGRTILGYRQVELTLNLDKLNPRPSVLKNQVLQKIQADLDRLDKGAFEELTTQARKRGQENFKKDMVTVNIEGADSVDYSALEQEIIETATKEAPIREAVTDAYRYQDGWRFDPNALELNRHRLSRQDLATQLRQLFSPHLVAETRHNGQTTQVYTELERRGRVPGLEDLRRFEVVTPIGTAVPLAYLGKWTQVRNLKTISHRDGLRNVGVDFRYDSALVNVEGARQALEERLKPVQKRHPGVNITVGDANEGDSENKAWVLKVLAYCILLILGVLVFVLKSFTQPFIVALPIPLGIIGAFWALYFHGQPLTLMAMIGLLGVVGIAVNDSIVMTHQINQSKDGSGQLSRQAIIEGAVSRLRAIFLTSTTTIAGVIPVAYGLGGESGFTQPIAFTMGFGLLSSSAMTLLLLPALLAIREDVLDLGRRLLTRFRKAAPARMEPAAPLAMPLPAPVPSAAVLARFERDTEQRPSGPLN